MNSKENYFHVIFESFCLPDDFAIFINKIYVVLIETLNENEILILSIRQSKDEINYFTDNIKQLAKEWNRWWTRYSNTTKDIVSAKMVTRILFIQFE